MDMTDPLLEVEDLEVAYQTPEGRLTAVSDATFSVEREQFFGLVGESGCGKSTLIKSIINGLDPNGAITSGTIKYKGKEIQNYSEEQFNEEIRWDEVSYIPQGSMNSLDPIERINKQAVRIGKAHTDLGTEELLDRLRELFDVVGIPRERIYDYPHQFSGGMKQRAIIALSLLLEPELVIADEPTTALDVIMQDQIFKHLTEIKTDFDTSLLMITHDISVTFEMCDKISIMHAGQICETATPTQLYDQPLHPYSIALQRSFPSLDNIGEELGVIEGYPPTLYGDDAGNYCHYVDRCPLSTEECRQYKPPLEQEGDERHFAACFHTDRADELRSPETAGGDTQEVGDD